MLALIVLCSIFTVISLPIIIYWAIVFLRRIYSSRKYARGAARHLTNDESSYLCQQICYHYRTEIGKYSFMFAITIIELIGGVSYYIKLLLEEYNPIIYKNQMLQLDECANWNYSILMNIPFDESGNPLLLALDVIGHVADLCVAGLGVCLMSYLFGKIKHIDASIINIKRFILILSSISVLIVLFSLSAFLRNLSKLFFTIALSIYYIMFLSEVKRFKRALLQLAFERLAQHGSHAEEMRQYRYFCYSMNCVCVGFFLITAVVHMELIQHFIVSGLFFGDCYFPFYFFSEYETLLPLSENDISRIVRIIGYIKSFGNAIACMGIAFWAFPLIFVTIIIWINIVWKKIRGHSTVQFRYPVSSNSLEY